MGARRDFVNQALLDQRSSVYWGTIQPGCYQRWPIFAGPAYGAAMSEQGVCHVSVDAGPYLMSSWMPTVAPLYQPIRSANQLTLG